MSRFVQASKVGDILLLHLVGHGGYKVEKDPLTGLDRTVHFYLASDGKQLSDREFQLYVIDQLPNGVTLNLICDLCFSGGFVKMPSMPSKSVIFMHSSSAWQYSNQLLLFTRALVAFIEESKGRITFSYLELVEGSRKRYFEFTKNTKQLPGLCCTDYESMLLFLWETRYW